MWSTGIDTTMVETFITQKIVPMLFYNDSEKMAKYPPKIKSYYIEDRVKFPVYEIYVPNDSLRIIMCHNFKFWKVSISCRAKLVNTFRGLFDMYSKPSTDHYEGFDQDYEYNRLVDNHSAFTFETNDNYNLYTILYIIKRQCEFFM